MSRMRRNRAERDRDLCSRLLLRRWLLGSRGSALCPWYGNSDVRSATSAAHDLSPRARGHSEDTLASEVWAHDSDDFFACHRWGLRNALFAHHGIGSSGGWLEQNAKGTSRKKKSREDGQKGTSTAADTRKSIVGK